MYLLFFKLKYPCNSVWAYRKYSWPKGAPNTRTEEKIVGIWEIGACFAVSDWYLDTEVRVSSVRLCQEARLVHVSLRRTLAPWCWGHFFCHPCCSQTHVKLLLISESHMARVICRYCSSAVITDPEAWSFSPRLWGALWAKWDLALCG